MIEFYITALILGLCLSAMATGIFISMKIFHIPDITTDGSYTLGAVITAICITKGLHPFLTLPLVMIIGALAGTLTGIIHTKLKIDALLSGILVMTALYSINLTILGRSNVPLLNVKTIFTSLPVLNNENYQQLLVILVLVLLVIFSIAYLLKTDFGLSMRAVGDSPSMTKALGINNDRMKIIGLAIANSLTATSGYLVAQYQNYTDINMGIGIVITGLGSVLIADTIIQKFSINNVILQLALVALGCIIFQQVLAFALTLGIDPKLLKLITASFVLVIVSLTKLSSSRK